MARRTNVSNSKERILGEDVVYSGEVSVKDYKPDGYGKARYSNGDEFCGTFSKGDPVLGTYTFSNGSYCKVKYEYNFARTRYTKYYVTSGECGYRAFKYQTHDEFSNGYYKGEEKNGKRNGIGTYVWKDGASYTGGWLNNEKHGVGKYTYSDGDYDWSVWKEGKEVCVLSRYRKQSQTEQSYIYNDYDNSYSDDDSSLDQSRLFDENFEDAIKAYNRGDYETARRELDTIYKNTDYSSSYVMRDEWGFEHDFDEFREMVEEGCEDEDDE